MDGLLTLTLFITIFFDILAVTGMLAVNAGVGGLDGSYGFVNAELVALLIILVPPITAMVLAFFATRLITRKTAY